LAGRGAEMIVYNELTVGAENDLERATSMARRMVTHWGMSEKLGPVSYKMSEEDPFLGREMQKSRSFSEHTMEVIDEEVHLILSAAQKAANELLEQRRNDLQAITDGLMEKEELDRFEIADLIGPSVHGETIRKSLEVKAPEDDASAEEKSADASDASHSKGDSASDAEPKDDEAGSSLEEAASDPK
jgi:cell division protease FtsH